MFKRGHIFSRSFSSLKNNIKNMIPEKKLMLENIKSKQGDKIIDNVKVNQVIGGMRGIKSLLWDISNLDPEKGIKIYNKTIDELRFILPKHDDNFEPSSESLLWFLMTGNIPNENQVRNLSIEIANRSHISNNLKNIILDFPKDMHPMTQFSCAIMHLQKDSIFAKKYKNGIKKNEYWEYIYEDVLDIISKLPEITSLIYNHTYKYGQFKRYNKDLDYSTNFSNMLGVINKDFYDLMRLYILIHCDHEGGNASAHTCRLVSSTLSDPYLSLSSSLNALAGPLHGLANQEVLIWILELDQKLKNEGKDINDNSISEFTWETLNSGKVIPGYGHAVLRNTDPRYICQREFALKYLKDYRLFKLVDTIYRVVPDVLKKHGKTKNPYPNVDSHSGILLKYYGINEYEFYTVLFGVSRSFGILSQLLWDRALGLPLERPKSVTIENLNNI